MGSKLKLDKKARFVRDRAARGWSLAYQGSCIDPMDQSKPLDPTLKVAGARRIRTIRLLVNDYRQFFMTTCLCFWQENINEDES